MAETYVYECEDCGVSFESKWKPEGKRVCLEHGIMRSIQASREMHNRSGVAYDRWLESKGPAGRPPIEQAEE